MIEHNYVAHEREGWSVCTRCGMVRNYDLPIAGCRGVMGNIAVRGGMTMTTVEEETATPVCSVCARPTGFGEDKGEPPVNLARCPAPGGMECRAVAQAVAPWRRENETLRSNCDQLSSENASLASQVESMAMRIESLAEELAKPEDMRLREVLDALEGRAVIFDGLGARVTYLLDELDEWIARAGEAERLADERLAHAHQLQADIEAEQQGRLALRKRLGAREDETMGAFLERLATMAGVVPADVHERGWQWRPTAEGTAFAPPFGTIRQCRVCGCLVAGGPTACVRCAEAGA